MFQDSFIYCLESTSGENSLMIQKLQDFSFHKQIDSIYNTFDDAETFVDALDNLFSNKDFMNFKIIYLILNGTSDAIQLGDYLYSFQEFAEFFQEKMKGKMIHFSNKYALNLTDEDLQYFLDITRAKSISGYGIKSIVSSTDLDFRFFEILDEEEDETEAVRDLFEVASKACLALDFKLYH